MLIIGCAENELLSGVPTKVGSVGKKRTHILQGCEFDSRCRCEDLIDG